MASRLISSVQRFCGFSNLYIVRHKRYFRGLPPEKARSLVQRLKDDNPVDEAIAFKVDIGLPYPPEKTKLSDDSPSKEIKSKQNEATLEKLAREGKLDISLEVVEAEWKKSKAPEDIKMIAEHYGIFEHLFGDAYFYPTVLLDVGFVQEDESIVPVYRGNIVKPGEALKAPEINYKADPKSLWTLILTNLDGHLTEENAEYVHWFIGNIPGSDIAKGDVIYDYMPPFPPAGTGYHRLAFVLYKQESKIDYSMLKKPSPCLDLSQRTFRTLEFYRVRQESLTPAGLAFCQTDYDTSVKDIYHKILGMREPKFEYDFEPHYVRPQEWFPRRKPFNEYMDRYRDPKQINKEYIVERLKGINPFERTKRAFKYPGAQHFGRNTASWLKRKRFLDSLGVGRINNSL